MKRILHLIPRFTTGGAERLVLQYARLLDKKEFAVHVASSVADGELRSAFEQAGIPIFVGSREKHGGRPGAFRAVRGYAEQIQPDIIHSHLFGGDLIASQLIKTIDATWISTVHNIKAQESLVRRLVWKRLLKKARRVIAVSAQVDAFIKEDLAVPDEQRTIILNGIETEHWLSIPNENIFSGQTLHLGAIGRVETQKGHVYLFDALSLLPKDMQWELHMFGDGSLRPMLEEKAKTLGIAKHITWHGIVPDMKPHYPSIDVVVQPSLWEGLSLVVMESMAAGRLVVASRVAGGELIDDGISGYLVPEKNAEALKDALIHIYKNLEQAKTIAQNGRSHARDSFDIAGHIEALEELYESV